jgi:Protein of unknown function (DUF3515)
MASSDGPPRAILIVTLVLAVGALAVVLAIAGTHHPPLEPVVIAAVPAPRAQDPACRTLLEALPQRLGDYQRAATVQPAPAGTAAWQAGGDRAPVVLRCGLDRPADFVVGSPIQLVDQVQWFKEADPQSADEDGRSTWYAVDRPVYIALTLPAGSGPTPIQQLSDLIDHTMPEVPISAPPG